ncbi:spore-associated protein A [Actinoallomurus purpureus]|uniref:spore-associated protein A n=1 Tax=Actinoallomurus purpureus TaxID=478114 RepID=UPI00209259E3|nr:spore-associated protein A [Actinoallomurus purpureus]MCO6010098.1 spore-associated protein A [Actinoallomurus purpureus]
MRRRIAVAATVALASSWAVGAAAPAYATGPCGSGYTRIDVYDISTKSGVKKGSLELYYSSASGKNCALAYGVGSTYGTTTYKSVSIARSGDYWTPDFGDFKYYAGPVYVSAANTCIDLEGQIGSDADRVVNGVHCG